MYRKMYGSKGGSQTSESAGGAKTAAKTSASKSKCLPRTKASKCKRYGPISKKETPKMKDQRLKSKKEKEKESSNASFKATATAIAAILEASKEEINAELHVVSTDFHDKLNFEAHHTSQYKCTRRKEDPDLVLRRGATFTLTVTFDRPYDYDKHDLFIAVQPGRELEENTEFMSVFQMSENADEVQDKSDWFAKLTKREGNSVTMVINIPADCIIGQWLLQIQTVSLNKGDEATVLTYVDPREMIILLNPWSEDDTCYQPLTDLLKEYVLNSSTAVYRGSKYDIAPKPWTVGQFQEGVLDICLHLLRKAFGPIITREMGDPVNISRRISSVVNNSDNSGVLWGNWSGKYDDGKSPGSWGGSVKILKRYNADDGEPVKYGQCWVFSGVTVTVCRALGLPCKSVTNFASAHDTNANVTIERLWKKDEDGGYVSASSYDMNDSIWNFHVWNEVWMARPDLPPGYDGWQVIDSTPQEMSDRLYQCGPAPVRAIKEGECAIGYDTAFVFAEVNADVINYEEKENGDRVELNTDQYCCGKRISTKKCDGNPVDIKKDQREDETHCYKYMEGTERERKAVENASKTCKGKPIKPQKTEVEIKLKEIEEVCAGNDFEINVTFKNVSPSKQVRHLTDVIISLLTTKYTEEPVAKVLVQNMGDFTLEADEEKSIKRKVLASEYLDKITEQACMETRVSAVIKETGKLTIKKDQCRLKRPDLDIKILGDNMPRAGEKYEVEMSFKNPLCTKMTQCKYSVDTGDDACDLDDIDTNDVEPNTEWKQRVELQFTEYPDMVETISFTFDCKELPDISGSISIWSM